VLEIVVSLEDVKDLQIRCKAHLDHSLKELGYQSTSPSFSIYISFSLSLSLSGIQTNYIFAQLAQVARPF